MSDGVVAAIIVIVILIVFSVICIIIWACRRQISEHIAKARAQHLQHYSSQTNEHVPQPGMEYPVTGYDQDVMDYRLEYRQDLGEPATTEYTTGVVNPAYTGGAGDDNSAGTTHKPQRHEDDTIGHVTQPCQEDNTGHVESTGRASSTSQESATGSMIPAIQVTGTTPAKEAEIQYNDVLIY
jgi:hypothetical protein